MLFNGARFNGLDLSEQQLIDCGYNGEYVKLLNKTYFTKEVKFPKDSLT